MFVGTKKAEKEGQLVELVGDQGQSPEAPPRSKRGGSKEILGEELGCQGH